MDVFGSTTKKTREGASPYATSFYSAITFNFRTKGRELILLQLLIKSALLSLPHPTPSCRRY